MLLAMLVPDRNGCPCCTNPPTYFVTDAATCLLGNPLAHAVRHRVALYGRDTTVWLLGRRPPDPGGYSTHSSPILYPVSCILYPVSRVPRRAKCRTLYHSLPPSHQGASSLLGSRNLSGKEEEKKAPTDRRVCMCLSLRADWQGWLLTARSSGSSSSSRHLFSRASHHVSSHPP